MMIKPEKAIEIVTNYLNSKEIPYIKVFENAKLEKGLIPYGPMEGRELMTYTVCYDYESYDGDAHIFITINAEDGTMLYGSSSTGFFDID